jgi:RNA polymerase sigma factor (sigma-70 family)
MMASQLSKVVEHLRSVLVKQDAASVPDGDLLKRYVRDRDEIAFEALVRRHAPMVMGVCRRVLHNRHDIEDAFQTVFLVLVRKASTLRSPGLVGNWLYGVAYRTALEAKKAARKRRAKESKPMPRTETSEDTWTTLRQAIDQELERLPDKYRAVIVLCDLEDKTRKEAARHLGWPEGTVASRLASARKMLAKRLSRHGLLISGGAVAAMLSENASASVPTSVLSSSIKAGSLFAGQEATADVVSARVAALTEGVLKTMLMNKLKVATAVLLGVAVLGFGTTVLTYQTPAAGQEKTNTDAPRRATGEHKKTVPDGPHDFTNLQRLAAALENFNYPENAATSITVWRQGGGKGTSITVNANKLDLTEALTRYWAVKWEGFDLDNVAIVSADDKTIRFVNAKDNVASRNPSGLNLYRGDLVVVLQRPKNADFRKLLSELQDGKKAEAK